MQLSTRRTTSLSLVTAFAITALAPSAHAYSFPCNPQDLKRAAGATALFTALACFVRLVTKKTQPKRVYPADDSFSELAWYIFDELLTGQMEKGERPSKVVIDDPADIHELTIQYSKVESRGLAGILYSSLKPVIIPTLTFMLLLNNDFLKKVAEGLFQTKEFLQNPEKPFSDFGDIVKNGPKQPQPSAPGKP